MSNVISANKSTYIMYSVVGRYMAGSEVKGYHLVGSDKSQVQATKERVIYMIGKGLIQNLRIQTSADGIIVRGKGVNLNTLPVYDISKEEFRGNKKSVEAANTSVKPEEDSGINAMGQLELVARIMYGTNRLGYVVRDRSGRESRISIDKTIDLAIKRLLSNAIVRKYTDSKTKETKLIVRGAGCNLNDLKKIFIDEKGNVIDSSVAITARATRMRKAGLVYDKINNKKTPFESGDYLVCDTDGAIIAVNKFKFTEKYSQSQYVTAMCDNKLSGIANYPIEIFGAGEQTLSPQTILKWHIVGVKSK